MSRFIRTAFDPVVRSGIVFTEPSLTKQSFKAECDINRIIAKWQNTGSLTHVRQPSTNFADFSELKSYQDSLNVVIAAEEAFSSLPSKVRARFLNDPVRFVEFASDPSNSDELVALGLVEKAVLESKIDSGLSPTQKKSDPLTGGSKAVSQD